VGAVGLSPPVDGIAQELLQEADCIVAIGLDPVELRSNWFPGWPTDIPFVSLSKDGQPDLLCKLDADLRGDTGSMCEQLAEAFDGQGHRVDNPGDLAAVATNAQQQGGLHIVEVSIDAAPYRSMTSRYSSICTNRKTQTPEEPSVCLVINLRSLVQA
jgi:thiamine pyrophosphate-dependent acetolactate synthase large subunit-like protein